MQYFTKTKEWIKKNVTLRNLYTAYNISQDAAKAFNYLNKQEILKEVVQFIMDCL